MEGVCLLLGEKTDWPTAKKVLSNTKLLENLKAYDKDNIPKPTIKKLQKYIADPEFTPEKLESVSSAAVSLCMWVRAMDVYARVAKEIEPRRKALEEAEAKLNKAQTELREKQDGLRKVQARVAALEAKFKAKVTEKEDLEGSMSKTQGRLARAEVLVNGLGSEEVRWAEKAEVLRSDFTNLVGNMMLSAGCISYMGPFTADYRKMLVKAWNETATEINIPVDPNFSFTRVLSDPLEVYIFTRALSLLFFHGLTSFVPCSCRLSISLPLFYQTHSRRCDHGTSWVSLPTRTPPRMVSWCPEAGGGR
jgi:dynein heavy chain